MSAATTTGTSTTDQPIEQLAVNTIRTLSMDAVQAANSGHPGTPMALAPVAYELWQNHLRFDPALPVWADACPAESTNRSRLAHTGSAGSNRRWFCHSS